MWTLTAGLQWQVTVRGLPYTAVCGPIEHYAWSTKTGHKEIFLLPANCGQLEQVYPMTLKIQCL
jgi:hypothetical protein